MRPLWTMPMWPSWETRVWALDKLAQVLDWLLRGPEKLQQRLDWYRYGYRDRYCYCDQCLDRDTRSERFGVCWRDYR